jgi:LysR family transcriptional regulator, glycine cleavage system transcriptional activator
MQRPIHRLPSFDRLVVFDAAARHLSFTKAATERFLTQSAVSRQVATLEAELGVPLFRRGHRRLELTDDGRRMATAVSLSISGVREVVEAIRSPRRREVLAVTTTPGLASLWLIPRLSDFVAAHPGIDVRIDATLDARALAADGFDLAIRYVEVGSQAGLPLFRESVQPVCAPTLLAPGRPPLRNAADLHAHTLLQLQAPTGSGMPLEWQTWLQAAGAGNLEPAAILTFTQYDAAVAAAVAGQGVVLGRRPLVDELLRGRALVAPFEASTTSARGYAVVVEPVAGRKPAVQALVKWLLDQAADTLGNAVGS